MLFSPSVPLTHSHPPPSLASTPVRQVGQRGHVLLIGFLHPAHSIHSLSAGTVGSACERERGRQRESETVCACVRAKRDM